MMWQPLRGRGEGHWIKKKVRILLSILPLVRSFGEKKYVVVVVAGCVFSPSPPSPLEKKLCLSREEREGKEGRREWRGEKKIESSGGNVGKGSEGKGTKIIEELLQLPSFLPPPLLT